MILITILVILIICRIGAANLPKKNCAAKHSELCYISHAKVFIVPYKLVTNTPLSHQTM